jgi:hypothetical protein
VDSGSAFNLFTIDITELNGRVTLMGTLGQDIIGQQGMAFDQSTGELCGILGNLDLANYAFGTINMTTDVFTPSVSTGGVQKTAIAPVP